MNNVSIRVLMDTIPYRVLRPPYVLVDPSGILETTSAKVCLISVILTIDPLSRLNIPPLHRMFNTLIKKE